MLSSYGEIQAFRSAELRSFDIEMMARTQYDITSFQHVLFCAPSFEVAEQELLDFLASF